MICTLFCSHLVILFICYLWYFHYVDFSKACPFLLAFRSPLDQSYPLYGCGGQRSFPIFFPLLLFNCATVWTPRASLGKFPFGCPQFAAACSFEPQRLHLFHPLFDVPSSPHILLSHHIHYPSLYIMGFCLGMHMLADIMIDRGVV